MIKSFAIATVALAGAALSSACLAAGTERHGGAAPPAEAVATSHPLATEVGLRVLREGGNAFDAAVAVAAALAVVEPYDSGLGGGGFFLMHSARDGRDVVVDARETAPGAATGDMYLDRDGRPVAHFSTEGPLAAAIPGTVAALDHITAAFGSRPLAANLAPAIALARDGFPADATLSERVRKSAHRLSPAARTVYMPGGRAPRVGQKIVQRDLAATLQAVAARGREGFYAGPVASRLRAGVFRDGGIWSLGDLAAYRVVERQPATFAHRGHRITTVPLPSASGVALAQIFGMMEARDWPPPDNTAARHEIIEAMRLSYRDIAKYLADPAYVNAEVERITSAGYIGELARGIGRTARQSRSMDVAALREAARDKGRNTTHFSILDRHGNRVGATLSINEWFGSGYMPPGTGVMLNSTMDDFATAPLVRDATGRLHLEANHIQPHKRPLSTMAPTFVEGPRGVFITGTAGGSRIITSVMLSVLGHINRLSVEQTVNAPRFHHQFLPDVVEFESRALTISQQKQLRERGHRLDVADTSFGNMQAVHWDTGARRVEAASDPRGQGSARVQSASGRRN